MIRPDQERFDLFAQQVSVLDDALGPFCEANGFECEVNAYRTPCRVLRRQGLSREIVDIYLDGDWRDIEYSERLPCIVAVCSYFETPDKSHKLYKISRVLANESSFLSLAPKIDTLLRESLRIFSEWVPVVVMAGGEEIENMRRMFGGGEPGQA